LPPRLHLVGQAGTEQRVRTCVRLLCLRPASCLLPPANTGTSLLSGPSCPPCQSSNTRTETMSNPPSRHVALPPARPPPTQQRRCVNSPPRPGMNHAGTGTGLTSTSSARRHQATCAPGPSAAAGAGARSFAQQLACRQQPGNERRTAAAAAMVAGPALRRPASVQRPRQAPLQSGVVARPPAPSSTCCLGGQGWCRLCLARCSCCHQPRACSSAASPAPAPCLHARAAKG
jgi:hypothetical protein